MRTKPLIATVIGDPGGIGPEVCVKALATDGVRQAGDHLLIGSRAVVERAVRTCGLDLDVAAVATPAEARGDAGRICVLDDGSDAAGFAVGAPSAEAGRATRRWMLDGFDLAATGRVDGIIVAPVDTTSFELAAIDWLPFFEIDGCYVLRTTGKLRTIPISEHLTMREVPDSVTRERVLHVITLIGERLRRWGVTQPKIAVAGLNPHCVGPEEPREIEPAVAAARAAGFDVTGPLSPDTVFGHGLSGRFDVIVTMYHDQGQIATKTVGLGEAYAIFVGLPYLRVGIPHGSAMDIAGTGTAQSGTAATALRMAAQLAGGAGL